MPRRIEVELTSERADGTWTWRAAGAKQPKGEVSSALLFAGAKVGDVVRADADFDVDGITIVAVQPPKEKQRNESERIEVIGTIQNQPAVTTALVEKGRRRERSGGGRDRGDRGERKDRGDGRRGAPRDGDRERRSGAGRRRRHRRATSRASTASRASRAATHRSQAQAEAAPSRSRAPPSGVGRSPGRAQGDRRAGPARWHPCGPPGDRQAERGEPRRGPDRDQRRTADRDRRGLVAAPAQRRVAGPSRSRAGRCRGARST